MQHVFCTRPRIGLLAGAGLLLLGMLAGCTETRNEKISSVYELKSHPTAENRARIRELVHDPDPQIRATALHALGDLGGADVAPLAREALDDEDGFVRATAAKVLGEVGSAEDVPALGRLLAQDPEWRVRERAAEALTALDGEAAVDALVRGLADPIEQVRLAAVRGVGDVDPSRAEPALARLLLEDPMYEVRVQAARALGSTGDPGILPVLEKALEDPNEFVRAAAANALRVHGRVREGSPEAPPAEGTR